MKLRVLSAMAAASLVCGCSHAPKSAEPAGQRQPAELSTKDTLAPNDVVRFLEPITFENASDKEATIQEIRVAHSGQGYEAGIRLQPEQQSIRNLIKCSISVLVPKRSKITIPQWNPSSANPFQMQVYTNVQRGTTTFLKAPQGKNNYFVFCTFWDDYEPSIPKVFFERAFNAQVVKEENLNPVPVNYEGRGTQDTDKPTDI